MKIVYLKNGKDIHLKGEASNKIRKFIDPSFVSIEPSDFKGLNLKAIVKMGDLMKQGTPVFQDKNNPNIVVVSPISGKVSEIILGEKRRVNRIVIENDYKNEVLSQMYFQKSQLNALSNNEIIDHLLKTGSWPFFRQRPYSKVANPNSIPKSIFVKAVYTEPLAINIDIVLEEKKELFQFGLDILSKLTAGQVNLCMGVNTKSSALLHAQNVKLYKFNGRHPAGNVSTLIYNIDPLRKDEIVWYIDSQDVLRIAESFLEGNFINKKTIAMTGSHLMNNDHVETVQGASLQYLLKQELSRDFVYVSGNVLSGTLMNKGDFVKFYDNQITVIRNDNNRELLGWIMPGDNKYSFSNTFTSITKKLEPLELNNNLYGGNRAMVVNDCFENLVTLDINPYFLARAILSDDLDEAIELGLLDCDPEDFALCSFACPSKTNFGDIIERGLQILDKEGY